MPARGARPDPSALRAFTADGAKAPQTTVRTFPDSPDDLEAVLHRAGHGEAVVTVLSEPRAPTTAAARLRAPRSLMGPVGETRLGGRRPAVAARRAGASGQRRRRRERGPVPRFARDGSGSSVPAATR
ncbi:DUF853 family protein [Streptomyces marianii]|uniref:DUF853 family protein n=1 Tax=Streptomyces marianii TaxID=1817406 RepID=A0A5R9E4U1_9ACTN|nr:DUF853 family protein [Streptomyces marianii]